MLLIFLLNVIAGGAAVLRDTSTAWAAEDAEAAARKERKKAKKRAKRAQQAQGARGGDKQAGRWRASERP